jgi:hypothetical protein
LERKGYLLEDKDLNIQTRYDLEVKEDLLSDRLKPLSKIDLAKNVRKALDETKAKTQQ